MPIIGSPSPVSSRSGTSVPSPTSQSSTASTSSHSNDSINTSPKLSRESEKLTEHSKPVLLGRPIIRSSVYTPNTPQLSSSVDRMSLPVVSDTESVHGVSNDDFTQFKRLPKRHRCCCFYTSPTVRSVIWVVCTLLALSLGLVLFFIWPRAPIVTLKSLIPLTDRNYYSASNLSINYYMEADVEIQNMNYFPYVAKTLSVESFALNQTNGVLYMSTMSNVKLAKRSDPNDTLKVVLDFSYGAKPVLSSQNLVLFYQQCYKDQSVRLVVNVNVDYQWTAWTGHIFSSTASAVASCPMTRFTTIIKNRFPQLVPGASGSPPRS